MTSSAICEAWRVATLVAFAWCSLRKAASFRPTEAGRSPRIAASNAARLREAAWRFSQSSRARRPRSATLAHAPRTDAGTSKGAWLQPSEERAASISAAPSGAPWVLCEPAMVGAPLPMTVRQAISDGLAERRALAMAAATASGSCPSTDCTSQPAARKRIGWFIEVASVVFPSIEMPLSSHSTISRDSFRWPARSMASWLMPSCRQPSPATT